MTTSFCRGDPAADPAAMSHPDVPTSVRSKSGMRSPSGTAHDDCTGPHQAGAPLLLCSSLRWPKQSARTAVVVDRPNASKRYANDGPRAERAEIIDALEANSRGRDCLRCREIMQLHRAMA